MLFSSKISLSLLPLLLILLMNACSDSGEEPSSQGFVETIDFSATSAFNTFDATTFSASTCSNIPIEIPHGIFASPTGKSDADGSIDDPLDLQTALSAVSPVNDGETLWLLPGRYKGAFTAELSGSEMQPISVRPLPGKRVIIDTDGAKGAGLNINYQGQWVNYYGLEILSSSRARESTQRGSGPTDLTTNGGVNVFAANTNIINFIVHDNVGGGFGSWRTSPLEANSELYGNIIYNNGWTAPDRGHGHAIYIQNQYGYKKMTSNIIFFGFATGIHAYTEGGQINNFDIQKNVWFMTGASDPRESQKKDNCLVGGYQPVIDLVLKANLGYSENSRGTRIGYGGDVAGQNALLENNYLSENFWVAGEWEEITISNTSILRGRTGSSQSYVTDLGGNDFQETPPSSGKKIFVQANTYDERRARVVIYNYDQDENVSVDLSSVLTDGEAYRIHSVFGLFDAPLLSGVYRNAESITIPMGTVKPPQPNGLDGIEESDDPHKTFGTFIVTHGGCT